ncbi:peroxisome proliferator-activated receptor gamma coactivator-related protein 1-like [Salvelinus fontinalis]|uniref:peroxisome proliferator-activated receptor gamma coactivator-related protein 1-like n=1 Tax=Salvelinus fontinalis TaxID=8038 RepID=UPI002486668E|nr:peroxisome proliferator-activated receptor gamma coactivator-related protein 1-like [Salvelinus fontinalis]
MAARWGAGEAMLTACNMDFFSTNTLDEAVILHGGMSSDSLELETGEALEALCCLDASILSIFEDTTTGENKVGLDEDNEATLLTALTEILDNVDNENLSPFDTLPDSDLLTGQKGREHSPLRKMLCLSHSPPEGETPCNTRQFSTGKSLPRTQESVQRSDGEEEEDAEACSPSLSPDRQPSSPEQELLNWGGLSLPLALEQHMDGESMSVSLGELVRHMHPYCMAVCMEDEGEELLLAEEGILLEVVEHGEHGETIFAIPDMGCSRLSLSLPGVEDSFKAEQRVPDEISEVDMLETPESEAVNYVVVDDTAEVADPAATLRAKASGENVIYRRPKEETVERCLSRRKKKRKNKVKRSPAEVTPEPAQAEGRVLRSASHRCAAQESWPRKPVKETTRPEKKDKESFSYAISVAAPEAPKQKTRATHAGETQHIPRQSHVEVTTLTLSTHPSVKVIPASDHVSKVMASDLLPVTMTPEKVPQRTTGCEKPQSLLASAANPTAPQAMTINPVAPQALNPSELPVSVAPQAIMQSNGASLAVPQVIPQASQAIEPKPKPLSLQQYRLLRQQKKPAPLERPEDQSTKWPSLPDAPTELPPIPCLPIPSPRDPRRPHPSPGKTEVEVKAAWQPMGPGAPPTPEALLVPPAYMLASKSSSPSKASSANASPTTPPQQAAVPTPQPAKASQPPISVVPSSSTVSVLPPPPQNPFVTCNIPQAPHPALTNPLLQSQVPCKTVVLIKSQSSSGASFKTTTDANRPTLIATVAQKPTPIAAALLEKTVNCTANAAAVCVQKPAPAAPLKVVTTLQKGVVTLPWPKMPELPTVTPGSTPAKPSTTQSSKPAVRCTTAQEAPKAKSPTQELIEAFTSEIGIEAADLTSLLEQFEETQAKEEQYVLEVSGRAAAVGNSSMEQPCDRTVVERVCAHDLTSTAGLTPPATPPHQMWKPLAPVALLGKSRAADAPKPSPSKAIQINARPLPATKPRSKPPSPSVTPPPNTVALNLAFSDHDYCLPQKVPVAIAEEPGKRWNVKQQAAITIRTIEPLGNTTTRAPQRIPAPSFQTLIPALGTKTQQAPLPLDVRTDRTSSALGTPEASPTRQEQQVCPLEMSPKKGRSYRGHNITCSPSPREGKGGRERKRRIHHSSSPCSTDSESDFHSSSSQSRSCSPPRKRYRPRHSKSSSSSSSCSSRSSSRSSSPSVSRSPPRRRYSYSSSRSGSWSRSRSRSPHRRAWRRGRSPRSPSLRPGYRPESRENSQEVKRLKEKAIEERRVVYVGRIRGTMTRKELRERFSYYGEIEECTLHFRDHGDNYGFVTYYDTKDAFTAIENGGKLRKPDELPFDLCFGGRRQFCNASYADLDSNREYDPSPAKGKFDVLDFDTLLKQAQKGLKR